MKKLLFSTLITISTLISISVAYGDQAKRTLINKGDTSSIGCGAKGGQQCTQAGFPNGAKVLPGKSMTLPYDTDKVKAGTILLFVPQSYPRPLCTVSVSDGGKMVKTVPDKFFQTSCTISGNGNTLTVKYKL